MKKPKILLPNGEKNQQKQDRGKQTTKTDISDRVLNLIEVWQLQQHPLDPPTKCDTKVPYSELNSANQSEEINSVTPWPVPQGPGKIG